MDKYTLMCSKLKPLQEGWEPKTGDWVYRKDKEEKFCLYYNEEHGAPPRKYIDPYTAVFLPSLEQLIEILEGIYIFLSFNKINNEWTASNPQTTCQFNGNTHQEALLKLVAYEKWGLTWSDEKEAWEDNNAT